VEGAGRQYFQQIGAEPGDAIILVSTSGRNAFPIEMAMAAKEAGLVAIGMTSLAYSRSVASRHPSGKKMHDFCDVVLDNLTVPGDAILEDDRLPQKVGPTSGWAGCLMLQALMRRYGVAGRYGTPPIYYAPKPGWLWDYVNWLTGCRSARDLAASPRREGRANWHPVQSSACRRRRRRVEDRLPGGDERGGWAAAAGRATRTTRRGGAAGSLAAAIGGALSVPA
jgi:hypothetical protein